MLAARKNPHDDQVATMDSKTDRIDWDRMDTERVDDAVLALLLLGLHQDFRAWKGFDWDAMGRLHEKGFISDPVGKAKSVVFSNEGLREAKRLFRELFYKA